jgi:hypothetical protein
VLRDALAENSGFPARLERYQRRLWAQLVDPHFEFDVFGMNPSARIRSCALLVTAIGSVTQSSMTQSVAASRSTFGRHGHECDHGLRVVMRLEAAALALDRPGDEAPRQVDQNHRVFVGGGRNCAIRLVRGTRYYYFFRFLSCVTTVVGRGFGVALRVSGRAGPNLLCTWPCSSASPCSHLRKANSAESVSRIGL